MPVGILFVEKNHLSIGSYFDVPNCKFVMKYGSSKYRLWQTQK